MSFSSVILSAAKNPYVRSTLKAWILRCAQNDKPILQDGSVGQGCSSLSPATCHLPAFRSSGRSGVGSLLRGRYRGFTLLELIIVAGLIAALSFFFVSGLGGGGQSVALQSAQAAMANMVTAARTKAMASGKSSRVLIQVDAASTGQPLRYLRYVAIQTQTASGWQTFTDVFLPDGVYVVPGNFTGIPAGLFAASTSVPWTKADGSALRSTALRSNQITSETINSAGAEQWVSFTISPNAGTAQAGDIILAVGRLRPPGSYQTGESPVELINPENVRGLTLSSYGVPALINARTSF